MEFHPKKSLRAISANSEFLLFTDDGNRGRDKIAYLAVNQCLAFDVCHSGDRVQTGIRGLSTLQVGSAR